MSDRAVYLTFMQGIITRLSGQSFQLKGWSITLVSAILAVAGTVKLDRLCLVALLPAVVFWGLDAYYGALERRFRHLFTDAFNSPTLQSIDLTFDHKVKAEEARIVGTVFSFSVATFHIPVIFSIYLAYRLI